MSTTKLSISVTPGKENRYFDLRVNRNSFVNDDGTPVRPEVLYESVRHALLGADLGLEMIMIRVGKYPAYRSQPHFAFHIPAQKRIYYDPLQAFRSSVTEINRRGSLRLWSFRSEADFWEVKPKNVEPTLEAVLSEDNLPEEVLNRQTVSAAPAESDLTSNPQQAPTFEAALASTPEGRAQLEAVRSEITAIENKAFMDLVMEQIAVEITPATEQPSSSLLNQLDEPSTGEDTFMGHKVTVTVDQSDIDEFMEEISEDEPVSNTSVEEGLLSTPTEEEDAELLEDVVVTEDHAVDQELRVEVDIDDEQSDGQADVLAK